LLDIPFFGFVQIVTYFVVFSPDSSLLCVSSSHGTIHVFAAEDSSKNKTSSLVSSAADFLGPASNKLLPKYFTSEWSFSKIEVPGGTRCICAFGSNNNTIMTVCDDGSYHKFVYDNSKRQFTREVYQMFLEPDIETVENF
jgi:WD40 repeat protein